VKRRKDSHVTIDGSKKSFTCLNCGASYKPKLPVLVSVFVAMGKAFVKEHKGCRKVTS
jgi:hypothetical protein